MSALLRDPIAITTLVLLVLFLPPLGQWEQRRLKRWAAEDPGTVRLRHYDWTIRLEWLLTLPLLAWWLLAGRGTEAIGLVPTALGWQWAAVGAGVLICALLFVQMLVVIRSPAQIEKAQEEMGELAEWAPRTRKEMQRFSILSITAGVCEEILYRGILLGVLSSAIGTWPAVVASSIVFALAHIYQGPKSSAKTGVIGLVLAVLTVLSGSIYIAMVVHAVLDLTSGRILHAAVVPPSDSGDRPRPTDHPLANTAG